MNIDLSDQAQEYGGLVKKALEAAGGDELAHMALEDPGRRASVVGPVLAELGAWDLDPYGHPEELEAAAALCRSAGYWATPYPVAERVSRPADRSADGLVVVGNTSPAAALAGLDLRWLAVTIDGGRSLASVAPRSDRTGTSAFVVELELEPIEAVASTESVESRPPDRTQEVALGLVLPCWTLLGMLDRALDLTRAYVLGRQQFGQPLAGFQGVQFQLTDAEVERAGAEQLGKYALWSIESGQVEATEDALAFRLAAVEAADAVFRVGHQLHGAMGFCDEAPLSWISRFSLPLRRLPFGPSGTLDQLTRRLGRRGLSGPFRGD